MPSDDLDKYLEDIGINVEDDVSEPQLPEVRDMEAPIPAPLNLLPEGAPVERAETFLVNVLLNLDPAYSVEVSERDEGELAAVVKGGDHGRSEQHTSELQSRGHLVCRLLLHNKKL